MQIKEYLDDVDFEREYPFSTQRTFQVGDRLKSNQCDFWAEPSAVVVAVEGSLVSFIFCDDDATYTFNAVSQHYWITVDNKENKWQTGFLKLITQGE